MGLNLCAGHYSVHITAINTLYTCLNYSAVNQRVFFLQIPFKDVAGHLYIKIFLVYSTFQFKKTIKTTFLLNLTKLNQNTFKSLSYFRLSQNQCKMEQVNCCYSYFIFHAGVNIVKIHYTSPPPIFIQENILSCKPWFFISLWVQTLKMGFRPSLPIWSSSKQH